MAGQDSRQWLFDEPFVARMEHYIQGLLNHRNRYTGQAYRDEPAIAVFEVINEPRYLDYADIAGDPALRRVSRRRSTSGAPRAASRNITTTYFRTYRYELVRRVVDRLAKAIRGTGSRKPVVWNLNWPQMILEHEDVFQAVADSTVDAVSFCLLSGPARRAQSLLGPSHGPERQELSALSARVLHQVSRRCAGCWASGLRGKAKVTYEFETFYNQTSYLYPAMARLFRALGSQMAMMWQYTLSPAATYCGGSHYLNLEGSPQKALSFRIASRAFGETAALRRLRHARPRRKWRSATAAISFDRNLSVFSRRPVARSTRARSTNAPLPIGPQRATRSPAAAVRRWRATKGAEPISCRSKGIISTCGSCPTSPIRVRSGSAPAVRPGRRPASSTRKPRTAFRSTCPAGRESSRSSASDRWPGEIQLNGLRTD